MNFISCASYYGSGSSAITDLVSEYENVYTFGDIEFRFIQDPDGISDLEYNLVENFNRHNSGWALKKYKKLVDFNNRKFLGGNYKKYLGNKWLKYSNLYISELLDFKYNGWWQYDLLSKGKLYYFMKRLPNKLLKKTIWRNQPERTFNDMKKEITYCSHPTEEKFLRATKRYMNNIFEVDKTNCDTVMVDQLVPPTNFNRYRRYFDNIKVIVVDRDPRDLYLLEKYVWRDGIIPSTPELFCKWFKYTRYNRSDELNVSDDINLIYLEDLIYNYERTVNQLEKWLDLDPKKHLDVKSNFDPQKSVNNTKLWKKLKCNKSDIQYIEKHLHEYLYTTKE